LQAADVVTEAIDKTRLALWRRTGADKLLLKSGQHPELFPAIHA
jgi:hypothetical protein